MWPTRAGLGSPITSRDLWSEHRGFCLLNYLLILDRYEVWGDRYEIKKKKQICYEIYLEGKPTGVKPSHKKRNVKRKNDK